MLVDSEIPEWWTLEVLKHHWANWGPGHEKLENPVPPPPAAVQCLKLKKNHLSDRAKELFSFLRRK